MAKKFHKMLSVVLAFVMVLSLCTPFMDVFAASEELTEVKQWNLILGDEIAANFYVKVSDSVSSEAIMNVTDGYGTTSYNLSGTQKDENGNYIFTARMAAAQMGDNITLQLQDGATTGAIHTYKAVDYARVILKSNYSDNTKAMVKAMLNYGAAAQTYFGYNTEHLVNAGYESTEAVEIPAVETDKLVSGSASGISFYGASLVFESKVAVRFYFNVAGNIENYTFSTGELGTKNGMYYVEVAGINPQEYADTITLTVNDTLTVYYSPLQYISRMYTKTENADLNALLGAMYAYYLAAGAYEAGSDMLEENAENDWTNLVVDGGMSNAASYGLTGDKTAPGSSQSLKITTNTGDVGNVHLNTTGLSQLPDFTSGMVTGWFYFGDQRPMAFLRGIDSNWNKGITGIFTFEDMGNGWYYGYVAASDLGFEVDKANTNPAEIIRLAVEIPGGYTAYVDNLKWEAISVTEETEKANDLLAVSSVVAEYSTITAENSTDKVAGIHSLYSKKFTAKASASEKKSIRYELPQSYDLTQQALSMDVHRYGVESLVAMQLSLQDSNGNTIVDVLVDNIYWLDWNHLEIDIHKYLEDGKSLSDVKYLTFTFNFDADTTIDREIYIDNVAITPYETVESSLNGTSALYIGDSISISKPFKGWAGLLEERYGVDRTNVSVGGTTFSTIGYQIKEQLKNVPEDAEFDYIILDGGCNDMYLGASSFGAVSDLPVTAATSSFDDSTAIGGFEQLLSMLKRRFPTAKIGYIITYQRSDKWLNEFIPLAKDVCEKWGVSCLSLPETEPFIQLFNSNSGAHTTDTVHSNVAGYELIMEYLPQWMASIPEPEIIEGFEPEKPIEVFEGGTFAAGEYPEFKLNHTQPVTKMSFEYKITSGDKFSLALLPDWSSYYGYFEFTTNGTTYTYDGVTTEVLSDGYVRVTVDVEKVTTVTGTPSKLITILFIRGDWGNASGEIRNIRINGSVDIGDGEGDDEGGNDENYTEIVTPGGSFSANEGITVNFEPGAYDVVTFDYQITNDGEIQVGLLSSDWAKYYGYYKFNANGTVQDYAGVSTEKLSNGYVRATLKLADLGITNWQDNRDNAPETVGVLFVRGDISSAAGNIDNVRCLIGNISDDEGGNEGGSEDNYTEIVVPGGSFGANQGITVNFESGAYDVVTFDYQITNGGTMDVCLMDSAWSKYYGYFNFGASGLSYEYDGVSYESLGNGYIRVTLDVAKLNRTNLQNNRDNAPEKVGVLFVRGDWSSAAGSIDNVRLLTKVSGGTEPENPEEPETPVNVSISYEFTGNEANRAGYAEGIVTLSGGNSQESYELYWGNASGKLTGYKALATLTGANKTLAIGENVMIPAGADRLCVYVGDQVVASYMLESKAYNAQAKTKFAVLSDVHTNYAAGETYLRTVLKKLEAEGVQYVIVTGDIAESANDWGKYVSAVEDSGFTGIMMAAGGNHDLAPEARVELRKYAIYDGHAGAWVSMAEAPAYFANTYAGSLNITAEYTDYEGNGETMYYLVAIEDNAIIFMSQDNRNCNYTNHEDNFSKAQLNFVEDALYRYSQTHNVFIAQHADVEQLVVNPGDGGSMQAYETFPNVMRFVNLLKQYPEAIWMSGHTHSPFASGVQFTDKLYVNGVITDTALARCFGCSSTASSKFTGGSEGYVCYQYENDIVYEARTFKEKDTDGNQENSFVNLTMPQYSYIIPVMIGNSHAQPILPENLIAAEGVTANCTYTVKAGNQSAAWNRDAYLRFYVQTELTNLTVGSVNVDLTAQSGSNYSIIHCIDGWKFVQVAFDSLTTKNGSVDFAVTITGNGSFQLKEMYIEPMDLSWLRGENATQGQNINFDAEVPATDAVIFDYFALPGSELGIALLDDWSNFYGYFAFNENGAAKNYAGITTEKLSDGYIRVTAILSEITQKVESPTKVTSLYIGGNRTTGAGMFDNVQFISGEIPEEPEEPSDPVYRGQEIVVGQDLSVMAEQAANYSQVVLDMIVPAEGGENEIGIALLDTNWNYYGYFYLEKTGLENPYAGVSAEKLSDGYWRITINIDEIDSSRTHGNVGDIERVYINNHTTGGYIDNVQFVQATPEPDEPEVTYDIATGLEIDVEDGTYDYVTFDYKVTNDGVLFIAALSSDWAKYYGYYEFNTNGKVWEDKGVYCEKLDDGFFRVTLKTSEMDRTNNAANTNNRPDQIGLLLVGGNNTATGIIRNVKYGVDEVDVPTEPTEPETPEVPDAVNVSYSFSGNEASRAGYAEGTITVSGDLVAGRVYYFCWADANGKLAMYRPLGSVTVSAGQSAVSLTIGENVAVPAGADRIAVYQNNGVQWAGYAMLDNKAYAGQLKVKYAVVSDVHTNYNQGEMHWLNALKQFEAEGVKYIIVSGDIGESNADYAKYVAAVENSGFSGVIMACIGNHDQTVTGSINFKNYAIYDGSSKTWVAIDDAPAYFANQYAGDLDISVSIDGNGKAYYFATIGDNAFMFMDQELGPNGGTTTQDNFSQQQLNFVENNLYAYSATHTLYIVEHAPIEQLKVGDKFIPGYGGCIQLSVTYPNNQRFLNLLMEYTEAIWLSGHTHVQYDAGIMYVDKYYDASGNLTDTPIAHSIHVSSLAQPRWYEGTSMIMKNDYSAASQGYVCYQYENDVVYEARVFKNYTPDSTNYDESLFINEVEAINTLIVPLEKVSHDAPEVIEDLAVADKGFVRQGSVSFEDTDDGLKVTLGATTDRFEIRTGNQTKAYYNGYYLQFKIKTDLTSFTLGGCNYSGSRYTSVAVDLTAPGEDYAITDLGDGWKFVQIPFEVLGVVDYLPEFAIRIYNTNAAGTFYLKDMFISPFDYRYMRGDTFVGGVNKTVDTPVPTSDILSFEYRIIAGSKIYVALLHDWSNYFGYYYFDANGEMQDYAGITTEVLPDGYVRVTCDVNLMTAKNGTPTAISMIYISKNGGDASGYIDNIGFELGDSDEEEETAMDYAVAANGVVRAGSVSFTDTAEGLQVTFAAAGNRFEIKCGDQTAAANGTLQFKIKTDLTSIKLGGCNYSGGRKTTVTVDLTASADGYTVTDLGDGWVLVEVPMSVIGVADYLAEFAIRFYDTNAAGTFYLKDMNFVA